MNRVNKEQMKALPRIVAVDFDGVIVEDKYPEIGRVNGYMVERLKQLMDIGVDLILWTSRDGEQLVEAVNTCVKLGLTFKAINENHPLVIDLFQNDTRKVYADIYLDDKAVYYDQHPCFWAEDLGLKYSNERGFFKDATGEEYHQLNIELP